MHIDAPKKLFTVDDYYRMAEVGILTPDDRVELIEGEIIQMSPIGTRHAACVNRATHLLTAAFAGRAIVSVQNPLRLNTYNEPVPDVVLAKHREDYYGSNHPTPDDALLVIEVADTTLRKDRKVKLPIYARLKIHELWIEDLQHDLILVHRGPAGSNYQTCLTLHRGDSISAVAFPETTFKVEELLG